MKNTSDFTEYDAKLKENAKTLRRTLTKQERRLWYDFLQKYPVKIYKQRPIKGYIADFYCSKAKLVIELDGSQHYTDKAMEYDKKRTIVFESLGLKVIRYTNLQVDDHFEEVCTDIDSEINARRGGTACRDGEVGGLLKARLWSEFKQYCSIS
ncbi:MAG: endonuclease domain-containing protein [Firmicutes bacterium]|nr:endonuclease domain-containing protein [Bacillota bacterium]